MKCRKAKQFLTEYFYERPDEERLRFLENHFQSCYDCQQARAGFEATLKLIERREKLQVNEAFWHDFQAKLEQRLAKEAMASTPQSGPFPIRNLREAYRSFRGKAALCGFQPLLKPVLVKTVSAVAISLIIIWAGLYLFHGLSGDRLSMDDLVLLSEQVEIEDDLDMMQEIIDEEEIDLLLQIETYL